MVGAAFLLLALVARAHADGAHHGAGIKHGAGVVHNAVGHGCYPQTHYETHYRTRYQEVPVYKTLVSKRAVVEPFSEVLYSTIYRANTKYVTETEFITTTEYLTRVSHERVTETVSAVLYVPDYSTSTYSLTQYQPAVFTSVVYTTDVSTYVVTTTQVETVFTTVTNTDIFTVTHKSQVPEPSVSVIASTTVHYHQTTQTHTDIGYLNTYANTVTVTDNVIEQTPSYATRTYHHTQYVTTTNIEQVPLYVTQTVSGNCGPAGFSSPKQQIFQGGGLGSSSFGVGRGVAGSAAVTPAARVTVGGRHGNAGYY